MPPGYEGFLHYHDTQDELYFVHSGTARFEVDGEVRELGPGCLVHVESTTPRQVLERGDDDLVMLVIGGKDGYVERDGHLVDPERDLERRQAFGSGLVRLRRSPRRRGSTRRRHAAGRSAARSRSGRSPRGRRR